MKQLGVAVIGTGSWGRNHVRVYCQLPEASLKSVVDMSESTSRMVGEQYNVKHYVDPLKALEDPEVEAVSICTPTVTHFDLAKKALLHGKHVLVEKPMTNTVEEAEELINLAKENGRYISVGFVERFNPAVREAVRLATNGDIGDVILAHTKRVSRRPGRIGDVGVIKDLAIHDVDIVNRLFGDDAITVFANAGSIAHAFEDYANIQVCYENNRSAFIETNWLTPRKIRTLTITGTEGIITVEYITQQILVENNEKLVQPFLQSEEPLYKELESFVTNILGRRSPEVTGEDGLKALKICEAAIESAKTGRQIFL